MEDAYGRGACSNLYIGRTERFILNSTLSCKQPGRSLSVKAKSLSLHYCYKFTGPFIILLHAYLAAPCEICSEFSLPISISFTCICSLGGSGDLDPQQAAEAGITDQGESERGQSLWGWVLTKSVCGISVGGLKSSNLLNTGFMLETMGKIRPLPFAKFSGKKINIPQRCLCVTKYL